MSKVPGSDSKNMLYCSFCGKSQQEPKIRDEIVEDAAALGGKGFSARFGQYNGPLVPRQPPLRAIFCPSAGIFEGFRHRYAGGGPSFGRARPAPGITTSPEWRLLLA